MYEGYAEFGNVRVVLCDIENDNSLSDTGLADFPGPIVITSKTNALAINFFTAKGWSENFRAKWRRILSKLS